MSQEIKGMENNIPVRMVFIDNKEEIHFKSIAAASRKSKVTAQSISKSEALFLFLCNIILIQNMP